MHSARARTLLGLARVVGCVAVVCSACSASTPAERPSVLLITVDTLRCDLLEPYGHPRPTSPALDAFAASAVVFEDAQASSSWTLPALASLFTSLYTSSTGCWDMQSALHPSFETLAEVLRAERYDTAAVASHVFLGRDYGLHQGFTHFDDELVLEMEQSHAAVTSPTVTQKGLRFLRQKAAAPDGKPWLLWLHYFDPHKEYREHAGVTEAFLESAVDAPAARERALYEGEIAYTDRAIGEVLAALDELGLGDEVIVVFVADHGEELLDHGGTTHGLTLFREVLHVPLLLRVPGVAPRRVSATVRTIDVAPTLLELCGLAPERAAQGQSLVPLLEGRPLALAPAFAELRRSEDRHIECLVDERWKLVRRPVRGDVQLFDRERDPLEQHDVAAANPEVVSELERRLERARAEAEQLGAAFEQGARRTLSTAELERLEDLGYAGDG